jgi:hypothetical protein
LDVITRLKYIKVTTSSSAAQPHHLRAKNKINCERKECEKREGTKIGISRMSLVREDRPFT